MTKTFFASKQVYKNKINNHFPILGHVVKKKRDTHVSHGFHVIITKITNSLKINIKKMASLEIKY